MRQEQAGNEAGSSAAREAVRGPEGMRPFQLEQRPGPQTDQQGGPQAGGSQAFTSGQRARWTLGGMVGRSPSMERLFLQMRYLAGHLRSALIEGERGTGKQLAARTLHELGPVRDRGFISATADEFLSGANAAAGLEQARGGTLYLHSVDALSHEQQGRLLHLLGWIQQQQSQGARAAMAAGAPSAGPRALILSSRRALRPLVLYGKFRSDLYQQLSAVQLLLPPLRDRRDDIPMLVELFVTRYAESYGKRIRGVAQDALAPLLQHTWPANVAELESAVARAVLRAEGEWLRVRDLLLETRAENHVADPTMEHTMDYTRERAEAPRSPGERIARVRGAVLEPFSAGRTALVRPVAASAPKTSIQVPMQPQVVPARVFGSERDRSPRPELRPELRPDLRPDMRPRGSEPSGRPLVPEALAPQAGGAPLDANLDRAIMRHVENVLASTGGNKLRTARLLGISRSTLYRLLDAHAVAPVAPAS